MLNIKRLGFILFIHVFLNIFFHLLFIIKRENEIIYILRLVFPIVNCAYLCNAILISHDREIPVLVVRINSRKTSLERVYSILEKFYDSPSLRRPQ